MHIRIMSALQFWSIILLKQLFLVRKLETTIAYWLVRVCAILSIRKLDMIPLAISNIDLTSGTKDLP